MSTIKVDTVTTLDGTGNITLSRPLTGLSGSGASLTALNATQLTSGTVPTARLGTGTANNGVFLRGDGQWEAAGGGVDGIVSSADATAITITSAENVGIGTTTPDAKLLVFGHDGGKSLLLNDGVNNNIGFYHASGKITIGANGATALHLATQSNDALVIDSNGHIVMPKQPAFQVKLSGADQNNIAVGSNVTILFDTEIFDQNADFNTGTYTFTAPVTGRYQFNVNLQLEDVDSANTEYIDVQIITSNRTYRNLFDPQQQLNADVYYFNLNFSVLADMTANDTAYVVCKQHNGTAQSDVDANWTIFSGYLAC